MTRRKAPGRRSRAHDKHFFGGEFGEHMFVRGMALRGDSVKLITTDGWRRFLLQAAEELGMSPVAKAKSWSYPLHGLGGNGDTIVQPISESFLILDTWRDHGGAYLFICSCKQYSGKALDKLFKQYCLRVVDVFGAPAMLRLR